jgi:hemoglobin
MDASLYERLGGKQAVEAAVELFYEKVLADERIRYLFEGVDLRRLRGKQRLFLTYAFGGPVTYTGPSLREAHRRLSLTDEHFTAVAEQLHGTLEELGVPAKLCKEVMEVAASTRSDVLGL